ncbi:hypothetical protein F0236_10445 [Vibrio splendidus]|uniref:antiviral RADAR system adenosine triphosphatase RdrA n=1 Tax=Vibrio splendidus TaxID=29497 RepID=UPI00148D1E83|nr:antiviral RADAR system adenosine triphosphatase RdrA [Vibrio splendidus]NOJ04167.1 hypothetical protein [Vibrio splendidus]
MFQGVTLNLEKNEYLDVYSEDGNDASDLWQIDAKDKLIKLLSTTLEEAVSYKKTYKNDSSKIYAAHNSICISGSRGAGKTVFLRSAEKIWVNDKNKDKRKGNINELFFLDIIDPTLLEGHDRFANVLIAQLYNAVESKLESSTIAQESKNDFYNALRQLAESLGKASEFDDCTGIDRILRYRSGVQIERHFHKYVYECLELLNCSAIVVSIDDVDMALNRAFEVLDDIRRLLSCPFLIPLVSGDHKLYSHMTKVHFEQLATDARTSSATQNAGYKSSEDLADAYLTKIFPNHLRLPLLPIERLLANFEIKESSASKITYDQYVADLKSKLYPLCNGQERSTNWPKPSSAREVSQLVRAITPNSLINTDNHERLEPRFQTWAEQKQDGFAYTNCYSYSQLNIAHSQFGIDDLISFNPNLQVKENFDWASKHFYDEQLERLRELFPVSSKGDSSSYIKNKEIFESVYKSGHHVLRSMPALEFFKNEMRINKEAVQSEPNSLLLALYTHHDYYNGQGNRTFHVFFSRAFEILVLSILAAIEDDEKINWEEKISSILQRPPFYSIFAVNPTKMLDDETSAGAYETLEVDTDFTESVQLLSSKIDSWVKSNRSKLLKLKGINLFPLLSSVFNKTFTQLHILRRNMKGDGECLSDIARRFEYIFINALATFTRSGEVVNANTALTAKPQTIREHGKFFNAEKTFSRNLKNFISKDGDFINVTSDHNELAGHLISAIWNHPIFTENSSRSKDKLIEKFVLNSSSNSNSQLNINEDLKNARQSILDNYGVSRVTNSTIDKWKEDFSSDSQSLLDKVKHLKANNDSSLEKILEKPTSVFARIINSLEKERSISESDLPLENDLISEGDEDLAHDVISEEGVTLEESEVSGENEVPEESETSSENDRSEINPNSEIGRN